MSFEGAFDITADIIGSTFDWIGMSESCPFVTDVTKSLRER